MNIPPEVFFCPHCTQWTFGPYHPCASPCEPLEVGCEECFHGIVLNQTARPPFVEVQRCDACQSCTEDEAAIRFIRMAEVLNAGLDLQILWSKLSRLTQQDQRPSCGHSSCRQHWIDTGRPHCIEDEDRCPSCRYSPPRHAPGCEIDVDWIDRDRD